MNKKTALLIAVFSSLCAFFFNEYNLNLFREAAAQNKGLALVLNETIFTPDDEYYVSPVENYLAGKGWKRSPAVGNGDYFRRVPGYSLIYLVFAKFWGHQTAHHLIKYFQLLLFGVAVYCFSFITYWITKNQLLSIFLSLIYGVIPLFSGWLYYTMTEAITPSLMVLYVFYLVRACHQNDERKKLLNYIAASFFLGYIILTRPYTGIAGMMIASCIVYDYYLQKQTKSFLFLFRKAVLIGIVPLLMISAWTIRNYVLTSEFVPLEKAFHPQSLDRMKPEFEGLWSFAKCWGEDGPVLNSYHQPLYYRAVYGDTSFIHIQKVLDTWPKNIVDEFGYQRLYNILKEHQRVVFEQKIYYDKQVAMPDHYMPEQLALQEQYHELIKEYKQKHFFSYWFKTPFIYLKRMMAHSNTSNIAYFQKNKDVNIINLMRYMLVLLHISIYCCLFFNLIFMKNNLNKILFAYTPFLFVLFFTVIHREIEQRYMLPILPVMLAGTGFTSLIILSLKQRMKASKIYTSKS